MPVSEIGMSSIDKKFKELIQRYVPDTETPLIVCYDSSNPSLFVITENRAARIDVSGKDLSSTTTVRLENVMSIRETTFSGGFLSSASYVISLFGNSSTAIIGFGFPSKNELYFRFAKLLRESHEKIKSSQIPALKSPSERLREIDSLLASKLITESEYKRKREEILGDL